MFPRLYSVASTGKWKEWHIRVEEDNNTGIITTLFGYIDGKKQETTRIITKGKNIGKQNATTPYTQALSEAQSKWNKKKDEGYLENMEITTEEKPILPMLALNYKTRGHSIVFPCYVQPKLDGVRCIIKNGRMFSRKGKEFFLPHITDELKSFDYTFDGELYSSTLSFQELVGVVRREESDKKNQIYFVAFDLVDHNLTFQARFGKLASLPPLEHTKLCETKLCDSSDKVPQFLADYESSGFEGVILRNGLGKYRQNYRSKDLQKLKSFQDSDYPIIGFTEGDGLEKGCVIWECETDGGKFNVRPIGTREDRMMFFKNGENYVGKMLTVKYQELTEDGIPRFPVGIQIRDYEN